MSETSSLRALKRRVWRARATARGSRAFRSYLTFLDEAARRDEAGLLALQTQLLRNVLTAANNVPLQRERLARSGVRAEKIRSVDDLRGLAPVTKRELLDAGPDALVRADVNRDDLVAASTSGSTAEPFRFWFDPLFHVRSHAMRAHAYRSFGYRQGPILEVFDHAGARARPAGSTPGFEMLNLHYGLPLSEQADIAMAIRPKVLYGNRSDLLLLAEELDGRVPRLPPLDFVMASSEPLLESDRARLQDMLGGPVHNSYGLAEVSKVSWECQPGRGFHVAGARNVVEVLRDGEPVAPGETGEVVVTSLDNLVMPFIRYASGDLARLAEEPCPCGRPGVVLEEIEGREYDCLRRADGTLISPASAYHPAFKPAGVMAAIKQWQIVQEAADRITVFVVPMQTPFDESISDGIVMALRDGLGPMTIDVRVIDHIPLEANRKFRPVKRLIP